MACRLAGLPAPLPSPAFAVTRIAATRHSTVPTPPATSRTGIPSATISLGSGPHSTRVQSQVANQRNPLAGPSPRNSVQLSIPTSQLDDISRFFNPLNQDAQQTGPRDYTRQVHQPGSTGVEVPVAPAPAASSLFVPSG
jgi:hypothetical protein